MRSQVAHSKWLARDNLVLLLFLRSKNNNKHACLDKGKNRSFVSSFCEKWTYSKIKQTFIKNFVFGYGLNTSTQKGKFTSLVNTYLGNVNQKKLKTHNHKLYKKGCEGSARSMRSKAPHRKVPRVGPWYVLCGPCYVVLACAFSLQEDLNSNILKSSMLLVS
jgi:hypothetical protein